MPRKQLNIGLSLAQLGGEARVLSFPVLSLPDHQQA